MMEGHYVLKSILLALTPSGVFASILAAQGDDEFWSRALQEAPLLTLGAVVILSAMYFLQKMSKAQVEKDMRFLGNLDEREKAHIQSLEKQGTLFRETLATVGEECHAVQERGIAALKDNTAQSARTEATLTRLENALTRLGQ